MRQRHAAAQKFSVLSSIVIKIAETKPGAFALAVRSAESGGGLVMDHGLPLVPVVAGVLIAYTAHFAYSVFYRISKALPPQRSNEQGSH